MGRLVCYTEGLKETAKQDTEISYHCQQKYSILGLACLIINTRNPQRLTCQKQRFWSKPTTSKAESHHSRWYIPKSVKKLNCEVAELTTERSSLLF